MKKVIRLTENELTELISQAIQEQAASDPMSRAAALSKAFNKRTPPITSKPSQTKPTQPQTALGTGTYTNSTVRVNSDGTLEIKISGKGTFTQSCENGKATLKKIA